MNNQNLLIGHLLRFTPSQADVKTFQAIEFSGAIKKFVHLCRWYQHVASFEPEFFSLPGDGNKPFTAYGPGADQLATGTKEVSQAEEDDDDIDLFGSEDEEIDEEAEKLKVQRLEEYRRKKAGKPKPAAKSIVILDVKPWGTHDFSPDFH